MMRDLKSMSFKIIIQSRVGSKRFPGKMLTNFYGNLTLMDIVIINLLKRFNSSDIILATSDSFDNNVLCDVVKKYNIECYRGSEDDVLSRFVDISNLKKIDFFIRVCGDNPFIDNSKIEHLINYFNGEDYISYFYEDGTPSIKTHSGFFTELVSTKCINRVNILSNDHFYREHVTNYIYDNPDIFNIKKININNDEIRNIRLTIDTEDDFNLCRSIYTRISGDISIDSVIRYITQKDKENMINLIYKNKKCDD
jgi:spore coat polysaccharide biosynthesis protein SpsF (cytidylyltransferase family)